MPNDPSKSTKPAAPDQNTTDTIGRPLAVVPGEESVKATFSLRLRPQLKFANDKMKSLKKSVDLHARNELITPGYAISIINEIERCILDLDIEIFSGVKSFRIVGVSSENIDEFFKIYYDGLAELKTRRLELLKLIDPKHPELYDEVTAFKDELLKIRELALSLPEDRYLAEASSILEEIRKLAASPDAAGPQLPDIAPALWKDARLDGEAPPDFIKRVYEPWLGHGLGRNHVRKLDHSLSVALDNWLRKNAMPADLDLPTLKEQNDRALLALRGSDPDPESFAYREISRLQSAAHRRQHSLNK